jgi:ubiquinone/menaquinone biosynthesis C-methylase UbiE
MALRTTKKTPVPKRVSQSLLKKELEYLEKSAIHDWDLEYIRKGTARATFLFQKIAEYIPLEGKRLLDLGCGVGNVTLVGSKCFPCTVGLDISISKLKRAKWRVDLRRIVQVQFAKGDALRLPFIDQVFDLVIAYDLYEHIRDKDRLLEEILRVTNRKGFVVLTTGNRLFPLDRHTLLWFVDYLPRKLANYYVRLMKRAKSYEVFQPTYWSLKKKISTYSKVVMIDGDSVFNMIEDVYPTHFQKYRRMMSLLRLLVQIGIFKFVTPKYIVVSQNC